jgi:hypothetical protein
MIDPVSSSLAGIEAGVRQLERSAGEIARMNEDTDDVDLTGAAVDQLSAKHVVAANVAALRAADEMRGSLLDILG